MSTGKSLQHITVSLPCLADWDQMTGNDQIRVCEHCNLKVHNISELTYSQPVSSAPLAIPTARSSPVQALALSTAKQTFRSIPAPTTKAHSALMVWQQACTA